MSKLAIPLAAIGLLLAANAQAQTASTTNPDLQFAAKAASSGHAEVELGRMALKKSNRDDIRQFAQRMVDDHTKANQQLSQLAQHQHLRLPRAAEGQDAAEIKRLSSLSGPEFDRAYMDLMVKDHRQDVSDFQKEAQQGEVAPIKSLASQQLPVLQEHLKLAEQLQQTSGEEKAQVPGESAPKTMPGGGQQ